MKFSQILVIFLYIYGHFRPLALSLLILGKAHCCGFDSCVWCGVPPSIYGRQMFFSRGRAFSTDTVTHVDERHLHKLPNMLCTRADYISRLKLAGGTFSCITILSIP